MVAACDMSRRQVAQLSPSSSVVPVTECYHARKDTEFILFAELLVILPHLSARLCIPGVAVESPTLLANSNKDLASQACGPATCDAVDGSNSAFSNANLENKVRRLPQRFACVVEPRFYVFVTARRKGTAISTHGKLKEIRVARRGSPGHDRRRDEAYCKRASKRAKSWRI
jgi:hypothetical protein